MPSSQEYLLETRDVTGAALRASVESAEHLRLIAEALVTLTEELRASRHALEDLVRAQQ